MCYYLDVARSNLPPSSRSPTSKQLIAVLVFDWDECRNCAPDDSRKRVVGRFLLRGRMSIQRTKNFIRIDIPGTTAFVTGSAPARNVMWTTEKDMTIPNVRDLMNGIVNAVNFVSTKAGVNKPRLGKPGKVVETDGETFVKRLLFLSDDRYFVTVTRQKLDFGLYSKPVISIDGLTRDLASAMQCARSLGQAIEDAEKMRW